MPLRACCSLFNKPPAEADIKRHFQANMKRYQHPAAYRFAAIFFGSEEEDGAARRERAETVTRQIESGEKTFAEAAKQYSLHPSAQDGGLQDWMPIQALASLGTPLVKAMKQLTPGERTGAFRLESGIWLFEHRGFRAARPKTFAEARTEVETQLVGHRFREAEKALRETLLDSLAIRITGESAP